MAFGCSFSGMFLYKFSETCRFGLRMAYSKSEEEKWRRQQHGNILTINSGAAELTIARRKRGRVVELF